MEVGKKPGCVPLNLVKQCLAQNVGTVRFVAQGSLDPLGDKWNHSVWLRTTCTANIRNMKFKNDDLRALLKCS
jgi:hypothetical protein